MPARHFTRTPQRARRRRIWSRLEVGQGGITAAGPQQVDLLGATEIGGAAQLGWTVGPVILSGLSLRRTSASVTTNESIAIGIRVGSSSIEAVDQDPAELAMLDWMMWTALPAPQDTLVNDRYLPGDTVRTGSKRKLEELNETLWIVFGTNDTGTFDIDFWASVLVILP